VTKVFCFFFSKKEGLLLIFAWWTKLRSAILRQGFLQRGAGKAVLHFAHRRPTG
jgi:hypothetical protein